MNIGRPLLGILAAGMFVLAPAISPAADENPPATSVVSPTTQPAQASPKSAADEPARVAPDAKKLLDEVAAAYGKLHSLELNGTITGNIEAAGTRQNESLALTSSFVAPNKFRHRVETDVTCGSTGTDAYAYLPSRNLYVMEPAPTAKVATDELPAKLATILPEQDPSLTLALAKDPAAELTSHAADISVAANVTIGDTSCPALRLALKDKSVTTLAIDPQTHLIRQAVSDIKPRLEARGVPDVKLATYTIEYKTSTPNAALKDDAFAWAPPAGAKDHAKLAASADEEPGSEAMALVGKPAPTFALKGMDDKEVKLSSLKGKVVLLDFWATWCGPCRVSLPHIQEIYEARKAKGLVAYAIDLSEEKPQVQTFVEKTKLAIPVLLDGDGKVGTAYKADAIPETVLVGKDGRIQKVWIGITPPDTISKAVDEAMKQ